MTPYSLIESFAISRGYNAEKISRLVDPNQALDNIKEIRDLIGPDLTSRIEDDKSVILLPPQLTSITSRDNKRIILDVTFEYDDIFRNFYC